MAKQKSNDACMFCGLTPCECNKPIKSTKPIIKKATARAVPVRVITETAPVLSADPIPTTPVRQSNKLSGRKKILTQEERAVSDAIICLLNHFEIDKRDLERDRSKIDLPDYRIDALIWRQDNAAENTRRGKVHKRTG